MLGWALDRTERAEDAAIAGLWAKQRVATGALVEVEASVGRHRLDRRESAVRAGDDGFEDRLRAHAWRLTNETDRRDDGRRAAPPRGVRVERQVRSHVARRASEMQLAREWRAQRQR